MNILDAVPRVWRQRATSANADITNASMYTDQGQWVCDFDKYQIDVHYNCTIFAQVIPQCLATHFLKGSSPFTTRSLDHMAMTQTRQIEGNFSLHSGEPIFHLPNISEHSDELIKCSIWWWWVRSGHGAKSIDEFILNLSKV